MFPLDFEEKLPLQQRFMVEGCKNLSNPYHECSKFCQENNYKKQQRQQQTLHEENLYQEQQIKLDMLMRQRFERIKNGKSSISLNIPLLNLKRY